jgi:hypothetical protein
MCFIAAAQWLRSVAVTLVGADRSWQSVCSVLSALAYRDGVSGLVTMAGCSVKELRPVHARYSQYGLSLL